jgi:hypothetical protein
VYRRVYPNPFERHLNQMSYRRDTQGHTRTPDTMWVSARCVRRLTSRCFAKPLADVFAAVVVMRARRCSVRGPLISVNTQSEACAVMVAGIAPLFHVDAFVFLKRKPLQGRRSQSR